MVIRYFLVLGLFRTFASSGHSEYFFHACVLLHFPHVLFWSSKFHRVTGVICSPSGTSLVCSASVGSQDQGHKRLPTLQRSISQFEARSINLKSYTSYNESLDTAKEGCLCLCDLKVGTLLVSIAFCQCCMINCVFMTP